jgi:CheY-like chemotaxis protein
MVISKVQAKGLELIIDAEANLGTFSGDATRLSQGLLNFLSNAIKFTEAGTITLRARIVEQFEHETLLRFEVIDTGIGIKKENMGRLFQIFEQGDNSMTRRYGGTGLGLAITKRIANLMGGEVGADSTEGAGSKFWLTIKLEKNNAQTKSRFMPELLGKRVLVVDDVPTTRLVHTHLMLQVGLECDSVGSGAEAMTALITADQAGKPYHLVLIDMLMPEMDGFELLATLRVSNLSLQPQAWLVTASGESAILENSLPIGFDEVLAKPLSPTLLHESLLRNLPTLINVFTTKSPPSDNHNSQEFAQLIQENFPNIHVLLAEDEPINQEVASMLIEDINWTIDVANNGQEALALAQQNHYDLILMDMQMPVMGGLEATRQIRAIEKLRAIPIIAMTANAFIEDRNACLDAGMNDFVTKPVMPELLYETMHRWLNDSKKP